ncbi:MAG: hypothetical protein M3Y33_21270 [Actinomycetota bacterium]|nr:hypothetical protein [Actinomycetota bacterium]
MTWLEPEPGDGAAEDLSPLEPEDEPGLLELELLEPVPVLAELLRPDALLLCAVLWDVDEEAAGWAPARSRPWPRFRAAARTVSLPVSIPDRPSAGPRRWTAVSGQDDRRTSARPLLRLRGACELRGCGRGCG